MGIVFKLRYMNGYGFQAETYENEYDFHVEATYEREWFSCGWVWFSC
jgi:hypothetical protein